MILVAAMLAAAAPQSGNVDVDAFVADIAAGRRDAALARILEMNSISGRPNAVSLADEFVDKLLRCTFVSSQPGRAIGDMYDILWRCPDGNHVSLLDPNYRPPRIVVGEFVSMAERERRRQDRTVPAAPMPGIETIQPRQSAWEWDRIARDYVEALQGSGAIPPGPSNFLVRFADGRPNAYVTPEQLRHYLAPCRQAGIHSSPSVGLIVHWTCAGSGALGSNVVMQLGGYGDRITEGRVWVGWPPDQLPDDARLW